MKMTERYAHILGTKGVSLGGLGLRDMALRRCDALVAIRALKDSSVPILGGDVYLERAGGVELGYANWYVDRLDGETLQEFAVRSCCKAEEYVGGFPGLADAQPLFVLVISSK